MPINPEGVLVSGGYNGTVLGLEDRVYSVAGIFFMIFDQSGSRLIITNADKTIGFASHQLEAGHIIRTQVLKTRSSFFCNT